MNTEAIEIKELCKSFGDIKAVNNISFKVKKGDFFAFLGVNGAGKSTTISIICGQLCKDSGSVAVCGKNIETGIDEIKGKIGVVFQECALDKVLSVFDNLKIKASLYGITGEKFKTRLKELCELLDIKELLQRTVGKLSGGQRRRIDIARALLHSPEILILDEPTTGLDPQTRRTIWKVIDKLKDEKGMTVFLTTHYMEEAAEADYVVILDSGKIAAEGTPLELKNRYTGDFVTLYGVTEETVKNLCKDKKYVQVNDGFRIELKNTAEATKLIIAHPDVFTDYEIEKGGMESVFLNVTGKKPRK